MDLTRPLDREHTPDRLFDAVRAFHASLDQTDVAEAIADWFAALDGAAFAVVARWDEAGRAWGLLAEAPADGARAPHRLRPADDALLAEALETGRARRARPRPNLHALVAYRLEVEGERVAVLALGLRAGLSPHDDEAAARLLPAAAAALHNALAFTQTYSSLRDRVIEVSTIEVVSRHISATLDLRVITGDVLAAAMSAIDAARGQCALAADDEHYVVFAQFDEHGAGIEPDQQLHADEGVVLHVLRSGRPLLVPDLRDTRLVFADLLPDTRALLCVPIGREAKPVGALCFQDPRPNAFDEAHLRFVTTLAEHAAIAIENARLFEDRRRQIDTLIALRQLSLTLLSSLDQCCVVDTIVEHAQRMTQAREVSLYLLDASGAPALAAAHGPGVLESASSLAGLDRAALLEHVARTGEVYSSHDAPPRAGFSIVQPEGFEAWVGAPVKWSGQVIGVLEVVFADPQRFTHYEVQALSLLANQAAVGIENARLYEEVRGARDQLQLILDSTDEAMLLFDRQGRLRRFNPSAESMIGQPLHLYLGRELADLLRALGKRRLREIAGFSLRELRRYIRQTRQTPPQPTRRQFEQAHGGQKRHIYESGSPVLDENGRRAGWLLVWRDYTEEHQLEALRQELSSMIVHDLRNPISSISNGLDMLHDWLQEGESDLATMTEVIQIAQDSAASLLNLVQSLLDVARLEEHRMALYPAELDLSETADYALASIANQATSAGIELVVSLPPDLPLAWADGEKIQRVLVNLLDNALRYAPFGGRIALSAAQAGERLRVCVEDDGAGVPPEARSLIFDKYAQLENKALRGHKGTGLGLAFCKLAVEAHGGEIWIEDGNLGGAAFCFTLPLAASAPA